MKFQENPPQIDPEQDAINNDRINAELDKRVQERRGRRIMERAKLADERNENESRSC
jgi:hypothetical protein